MEKRNTFALTFFIRRTLANQKGLSPIFLRITVNGRSTEMRIQRSIAADNWNTDRGLPLGRDKFSREIHDYIETMRAKVLYIHREMEIDRRDITAKSIKDELLGKNTHQRTIKQCFEEHNAQIKKLSNVDISPITVRRYEKSLEVLLDFIKHQYNEDDYYIADIDPHFIDTYKVYLRANLKLGQSSVVKRLKNFKKVIRIALMNNWITMDPFRFTKLVEKSTDKEFLVKEEIDRIIAKEITITRLEQVRDIYLFCILTGLAFTDAMHLKAENVIKDNNGDMWIRKSRQKTKNMCNIPLLEIPIMLIDKYREHPGNYYLFVCVWNKYKFKLLDIDDAFPQITNVYVSKKIEGPYEESSIVTTLNAHAPEIFQDEVGDWFISSAQYPYCGVSIDKLYWK